MDHFKKLLADHHEWPCNYLFKFVVPVEDELKVRSLIDGAEVTARHSKNGRFVSVSITARMESPEAVIAVHELAAQIKGLISL